MFIKLVEEQLGKMSETEKDKWILARAKLTEESKQQGFLMSLSGEKKIIYMPSQREIEEFCEKVESGEIYLEYETHYYEFDDDSPFSLVHAADEGMLSRSISDIGADWVTACVKQADKCDGLELAKKLVDIFEQPICKKNNPSMLIGEELPSDLFSHMLNYYKDHNDFDGARWVAEQALEKCKEDLTDIFIYLLNDAEKKEDKDRYKKLYNSAKRRRRVDITRIAGALSSLRE